MIRQTGRASRPCAITFAARTHGLIHDSTVLSASYQRNRPSLRADRSGARMETRRSRTRKVSLELPPELLQRKQRTVPRQVRKMQRFCTHLHAAACFIKHTRALSEDRSLRFVSSFSILGAPRDSVKGFRGSGEDLAEKECARRDVARVH